VHECAPPRVHTRMQRMGVMLAQHDLQPVLQTQPGTPCRPWLVWQTFAASAPLPSHWAPGAWHPWPGRYEALQKARAPAELPAGKLGAEQGPLLQAAAAGAPSDACQACPCRPAAATAPCRLALSHACACVLWSGSLIHLIPGIMHCAYPAPRRIWLAKGCVLGGTGSAASGQSAVGCGGVPGVYRAGCWKTRLCAAHFFFQGMESPKTPLAYCNEGKAGA